MCLADSAGVYYILEAALNRRAWPRVDCEVISHAARARERQKRSGTFL
jgi:hypothetical protein